MYKYFKNTTLIPLGAILALCLPLFFTFFSPLYPFIASALTCAIGFSIVRFRPQKSQWLNTSASIIAASILAGYIIVSICMYALIILFNDKLILTQFNVNCLFAFIAIIITTFSGVLKKYSFFIPSFKLQSLKNYAPYICFVALSFIPYFLNRFAQDNDLFLTNTLAIYRGAEISLASLRPLFPAMQAAYSLFSGISPVYTYALIPLFLYLAGVLVFWEYTKKNIFSLLALFIAPVILTEIYITRPQVILLAYVLPLFMIGQLAQKTKSTHLGIIGLIISTILILFHELSAIFFLSFLGFLFFQLWHAVFIVKSVTMRQVGLIAVIAFPYLILVNAPAIFLRLIQVVTYAFNTISGISLEWWFIDSYISIDGAQLGWPGIQSAYYYLYNGAQLIALFLLSYLLFKKTKNNQGKIVFSYIALAITMCFFFFAEIAPRFGFTFLLNRAWPYIALGIVFLLSEISPVKLKKSLTTTAIYTLLAAIGIAGITKVAQDNVSQMFPEESAAALFLKEKTPEGSLIVSNQPNSTLVRIYGERRFSQLTREQVKLLQNQKLVEELFIPTLRDEIKVKIENQIISETYQNGVLVNTEVVSRTDATPQSIHIPPAIYYLYSKRKAEGRNAERELQYSANGLIENQQIVDNTAYKTVYEDSAMIILKVL